MLNKTKKLFIVFFDFEKGERGNNKTKNYESTTQVFDCTEKKWQKHQFLLKHFIDHAIRNFYPFNEHNYLLVRNQTEVNKFLLKIVFNFALLKFRVFLNDVT